MESVPSDHGVTDWSKTTKACLDISWPLETLSPGLSRDEVRVLRPFCAPGADPTSTASSRQAPGAPSIDSHEAAEAGPCSTRAQRFSPHGPSFPRDRRKDGDALPDGPLSKEGPECPDGEGLLGHPQTQAVLDSLLL